MEYLNQLEEEAIEIIREAVATSDNPLLLYSIGKDSSALVHLCQKAFAPLPIPFKALHVDTRFKFQEMYRFRDQFIQKYNLQLDTYINPEAIEKNINPFDHGTSLHTEITKTQALKKALAIYKTDMVFGGARRDEEKSRSKERIFSFRNQEQQWTPEDQRLEFLMNYNLHKKENESFRCFPLSNWSELDVWRYIKQENIPVVSLYFSQSRPVVNRDNMLIMVDDHRLKLKSGENVQYQEVRFRTLGCYPLTAAIKSEAKTVDEVIQELEQTEYSERQGRLIDFSQNDSMEIKKRKGYF